MKLFRFGERGQENPGVLLADGRRIDVAQAVLDYDEAFFSDQIDFLREWVTLRGASLFFEIYDGSVRAIR